MYIDKHAMLDAFKKQQQQQQNMAGHAGDIWMSTSHSVKSICAKHPTPTSPTNI